VKLHPRSAPFGGVREEGGLHGGCCKVDGSEEVTRTKSEVASYSFRSHPGEKLKCL
jgi:hypothetical protein